MAKWCRCTYNFSIIYHFSIFFDFFFTISEQLIIVPTLYVRKGNPVTLHCNVSDKPGHTEVFLDKSTTSTVNNISDSKYSNFTIHFMSNSDVGTYMCYAGNSTSNSPTNTSVMLKLLGEYI